MLLRLHLRDVVLVDDIELEFGPGFTVLTGETGAGKSILIDALKLALGEPHCTELVAVLDDDTVLPPGALDRARAALRDADLATGLPWYDSGAGPWNALVAGFVNGNALVTYFPLLGNHGLAVRRHGGRERPAGRRRTDAGPGHVRSCELVGASTSRSVAATMASK